MPFNLRRVQISEILAGRALRRNCNPKLCACNVHLLAGRFDTTRLCEALQTPRDVMWQVSQDKISGTLSVAANGTFHGQTFVSGSGADASVSRDSSVVD